MGWFDRFIRNACARRAVELIEKGNSLEDAGLLEQALSCYRSALLVSPKLPRAHLSCGNVYIAMGDVHRALGAFRTALVSDPNYAAAHYSVGNASLQLGQLQQAKDAYKRALELEPDFAAAALALEYVREDTDSLEDAEANYRKALASAVELDPESAEARWALAMAQIRPIYDKSLEIAESRLRFEDAIEALDKWFSQERLVQGRKAVGSTQPFYAAYHAQNNRLMLAPYGRLCTRLMASGIRPSLAPPKPLGARKLRVGFVSAQIRDHSVWNAIAEGWICHLEPAFFEVHVFHLGLFSDDKTSLARKHAFNFVDTPQTLNGWVQTITDTQLDALIYPEIGMHALTLQLAAQRLAPVQAAGWGHPHSTVLPTIDLFLSAELFEPEQGHEHYTEELIRLPNLGVCVQTLKPTVTFPDLRTLGLPCGEPLLLCAGTPFKYSPLHDPVWVQLGARLQAHGAGRLVFFHNESTGMMRQLERRLRLAFENAGLEFDHWVCFVPKLPRDVFYGLMHQATMLLDTIDFSGFNTALQSLECGLPVIAYEGEFMRGRLASGLLRRIGLDDWVAKSHDDFVTKAMRLALDPTLQGELREKIAQSRTVLFNDLEPVRALGQVLTKAHAKHITDQ